MAARHDTIVTLSAELDAEETAAEEDEGVEAPYRGLSGAWSSTIEPARQGAGAGGGEALPGKLLADRYRLVERLGEGAHGEVWAADDLVVRQAVALKWMRFGGGPALARIRREITALRMLRVPGVVRLLDDGIEHGRPFLVMERVEGRPFPGDATPLAGAHRRWCWDAIAGPTLALLEVLARVHAAGVVHRDLKPDNLLVSADGRPTVLDFGISLWGDPNGDRLTGAGQILGTPLYLAPEQIVGRSPDARADLYAVGIMLYEALCGRIPHEAPDLQGLLRARLVQPVVPAQELFPEIPAVVAQAVERLLALRREDRFRSALEVLAALRAQAGVPHAVSALPRLGGDRPVTTVVEAARAGRSVDVVGPPGSGRTRCLTDAAAALERHGRRVLWTRPAGAPLASLQPIVGAGGAQEHLRLAEMTTWVEDQVRGALAGGAILMTDDAARLDPWSTAVLDRCRAGPGAIVRTLEAEPPSEAARAGEVVRLEPLSEAALRPLFHGPDRLLHLREDAARALQERTDGLPARIEAELTLWVRLGLARWDGAALAIDRDTLGRLGAGLPGSAPETEALSARSTLSGEPHLEEICAWLALAGHHLELGQLARVMGQPRWRIEADCEALAARGVARRLPGERMALRGQVAFTWAPARRVEAHRAVAAALEPGAEGRLFHLLAAAEVGEAAREATALGQRRAAAGELGAAAAALAEGLRAVRQQAEGRQTAEEARILEAWVEVAFAEGTQHALDRVLYELTRAGAGWAEVDRLATLVRAGIAGTGASAQRALELAEGLPRFADPALERRRHRVRAIAAAVRGSLPLLEGVLDEVRAWTARGDEPAARLCLAEARARRCYGQGRFGEAAALHAEAAALDPWLTGRIAAMLNCASALLEAFRHEEAEAQATAAMELAARCRHPSWEARAEWLLRSAHYRRGNAGASDLELVEAVAHLGLDDVEALVCLNEAAVAFRAGEAGVAAELSGRSARAWKQLDRPWGALLARSLALCCGAAPEEGEAESLAESALGCPVVGIGMQALGLLGRAFPEVRVGWHDRVMKLVEGAPQEHREQRMDVLSMAEAIEGALGWLPDPPRRER